jgi:hypothetical protein
MTLSIGSRGSAVRSLQQQLNRAGFNTGGVDGDYGTRTLRAVKAFQRARGLDVDGKVGPDTLRALRDGFDAPRPSQPAARRTTGSSTTRTSTVNEPRPSAGTNRTASFDSVRGPGTRSQMITGRITINGNTYNFRTGGHGRGSLPPGSYTISPHLWSRRDRSMSVDGVGYSFAMSDKYDPRVRGTRSLLRIHPDGGSAGTEGCVGIVGNGDVQRRFREDMRAELNRNGGRFTLQVG